MFIHTYSMIRIIKKLFKMYGIFEILYSNYTLKIEINIEFLMHLHIYLVSSTST